MGFVPGGNPRASFPVISHEELSPLLVPYSDGDALRSSLQAVLAQHGAAVVTGVLTAEELKEFEALKAKELEAPSPQGNEMAHCQGELAWRARMHPRVRHAFASAFGVAVADLSASTDMPSLFFTPEGVAGQSENDQWLHVDQNTKTGLEYQCYQGLVYVRVAEGENVSTTVVWPRSHLDATYGRLVADPNATTRAELRDEQGVPYGHFLPINGMADPKLKEQVMRDALLGSRRMEIPAGALLLWNSRTTHQGWKGGPRLALPVCWEPRGRVGAEARRRKLCMAAAGIASTHSPSEGRVHPAVARRRGPQVQLPRPAVRPFCVRSEEEGLSQEAWQQLWVSWEGVRYAEDLVCAFETGQLEAVLRPEMAAVL